MILAVTTFKVYLIDSPFVAVFLSLIALIVLVKVGSFLYEKIPFV